MPILSKSSAMFRRGALVAVALALLAMSPVVAQPGPTFTVEQTYSAGHLLRHHGNASFASPGIRARSLPKVRLAWVTPWNVAGYERTLRHPSAFTHVAPCWFEAKLAAKQEDGAPLRLAVLGAGQANATWASGLKNATGGAVRILPRVTLPISSWGAAGSRIFAEAESSVSAARAIAEAVAGGAAGTPGRRFAPLVDGVALEWGHMALTAKGMSAGVLRFLADLRQQLADALDADEVTVLLVVPPDPKRVGPRQIAWLDAEVDLFAFMTYDYNAGSDRPKECAPMPWVVDVMSRVARGAPKVPRRKLLVGLNLYGYRFSATPSLPTAVTGPDLVRILGTVRQRAKFEEPSLTKAQLRERPALSWATEAKEHSFEHYVPKKGVEWVFFPSLASILTRSQYAAEQGFGVSAWELGQGLEYFMPIFQPAAPAQQQ